MKTVRLNVSGMTCGHCVDAVRKALENQDGVTSAAVHLDRGAAEVQYEEGRVSPEQLVAVVEEEGYTAGVA
jgi:copper chaperone CopZ